MTRENRRKAIELVSDYVCTVEMRPVINGTVTEDYIAITDCCASVIVDLIESGYVLSMKDGKLLVNKF